MIKTAILGFAAALTMLSAPVEARTYQPHLIDLEERIGQTASENSGEFGIAALDLTTGETVGVNANIPFPMASTMKIAVAAAYLEDVDRRERALSDSVAGQSAYALMDRMIVRSDNHATDLLIRHLGGPDAINAWLRRHSIDGMRVDRTIAQLLAAKRNLWENEDTSTPNSMLTLLQGIDSGQILSASSRATLLDMMRRCATGRNRIKGLMPDGAIVEHKTGTLNGYTGDVGFITLPDGRRLAVAFFARGGSNRPAVIASTARAIYDSFNTRRPSLPAPEDYSFAQATTVPSTPDSSFGRVTLDAKWDDGVIQK